MKHIVIRMPEEKWNDILWRIRGPEDFLDPRHQIDALINSYAVYYSDDDLVEFAGSYTEAMMNKERDLAWHGGYDEGYDEGYDSGIEEIACK